MIGFIKIYNLPLHPDHKMPPHIIQTYAKTNNNTALIQHDVSAVCNFPVISYLPSAIGVFIGMRISPNPYVTFFLGRFTLFLTCFIWLIYIYKKTKYKSLLLFVASIPMFLHQISAYGYDGVTFMLMLTLFVKVTELMSKDQMLKVRDYMSLSIISILYLLSRSGGHELLLLFILLIPPQKIHKKTYIYILYIIECYALMFGIYGLTKMHAVTSFIGNGLPAGADPSKQIQFILSQPVDVILVMIKTTVSRSMFYVQSMVGILGWLEYGIPHWMYVAYAALGGWIIVNTKHGTRNNLDRYHLIVGSFVVLLNYLYILGIFYVVWTPVEAQIVNGVQGRYFLPFVPIVLLMLKGIAEKLSLTYSFHKKYGIWILILISLIISISLIQTILVRYYMI
jgi:uncharacterized membrane protein